MTEQAQPYRIAILTKDGGPYHTKVLEGLYERLEHIPAWVEVHKYSIPKGRHWKQAREAMQTILEKKPALVISIGALCSQVARNTLDEKGLDTPLLFGGVTLPHELGLVPSKDKEHQTSGVSLGFPSHIISARILLLLKPNLKKLLVPYNPFSECGTLTNAALLIQEHLKSNGVTVIPLALSENREESLVQIKNNLSNGIDTIMTLEGCIINEMDDAIIDLCNDKKITFFASDIASVEKGAAAGFVADPTLVGSTLYKHVLEVIVNNVEPANLPVIFLRNSGRKVAVNSTATTKQNLFIPKVIKYFIEHGDVIGEYTLSDAEIL